MREILFRGQTRKKGEKVRLDGLPIDSNWVYGGIFAPDTEENTFALIYDYDTCEKISVYRDTVGQYTGLTDKNGVKIFEGDIVRYESINYFVEYVSGFAAFTMKHYYNIHYAPSLTPNSVKRMEVIGNIHDNPELL